MQTFCDQIIDDIKMADNEQDLIKIIGNSLRQLRIERNSFNEEAYILNMIVSLRSIRALSLKSDSPETLNNILLAINILRQFQKAGPAALF